MKGIFSVLVFSLLMVFSGYSQSLVKAKKALEKGDYTKTIEILNKSLEKDSLAYGAHYLLSVIYLDSTSGHYDRDSAKYWIEKSLQARNINPTESLKDLEKAEMSPTELEPQFIRVLEDFYQFTLTSGSISEYDRFMGLFPNAPQVPRVLFLRDSLAYSRVEAEDTWEAYKSFMDQYPTSIFNDQAKRHYEIRLFKEMTGDGSLENYVQFLDEYPETPFRMLVEQSIFLQTTKEHTAQDYLSFLDKYPTTHLRQKIVNLIYYQAKSDTSLLTRLLRAHPQADSARQIWELEKESLIPIFKDGRFEFFDLNGRDYSIGFDLIPSEYLCEKIANEWILGAEGDVWQAKNRTGKIITSNLTSIKFIGREAVLADFGHTRRLLHKAGFELLPMEVGDAAQIAGRWLAFKKDLYWGLAAFNGEIILQPTFKSIEEAGDFIILENQRGLYVTNIHQILKGNALNDRLLIDYFDVLSDTLLLGFLGDKEMLVSSILETPIPLDDYKIYWQPAFCYVKRPNGISQLYDPQESRLSSTPYLNIFENQSWRLLLEGTKWKILLKKPNQTISQVDSLKRLSDQHLILFARDTTFIVFTNGKVIVPGKNEFALMTSRNEAVSTPFLVLSSNKTKQVLNSEGNLVFEGIYESVFHLNDSTFVIRQKGKEGVIDQKKRVILQMEYDHIEGHGNLVVLLKKNLIGCLDLERNVFIPSLYQSRILKFGNYYEVSKEGKKGLITEKNKVVCPIRYDELLQWNDSTFWVRQGQNWSLVKLDGAPVIQQVSDITPWDADPALGLYKFLQEGVYGIISRKNGIVLTPQYNDILNLGSPSNPIYFAEQHLKTAEFFVVTYFNSAGNPFKSQAFRSDEYDKIYCEDSDDSSILVE